MVGGVEEASCSSVSGSSAAQPIPELTVADVMCSCCDRAHDTVADVGRLVTAMFAPLDCRFSGVVDQRCLDTSHGARFVLDGLLNDSLLLLVCGQIEWLGRGTYKQKELTTTNV